MSEYNEQCSIFEWAKMSSCKYPELELLNASLNGVRLLVGQAVKAKKSGMKRGYPDIFLPVVRSGYFGLFIELKVNKNKPSKEQIWWIDKLNNEGYLAVVRYGFEDAITTIKNYLDGYIRKEVKDGKL